MNKTKKMIDVVILAPTLEELVVIQELLPDKEDVLNPVEGDYPYPYSKGEIRIGTNTYSIRVISALEAGPQKAQETVTRMLNFWKPSYLFLVGVSGGYIELGVSILDFIIPKKIYGLERVKISEDGEHPQPDIFTVSEKLYIAACKFFSTNSKWSKRKLHEDGGIISTGILQAVIEKEEEAIAKYKQFDRKIFGIEQEASGVARGLKNEDVEWLDIRVVMDNADQKSRNLIKDENKKQATRLAAEFCFDFLQEFLNQHPNEKRIDERQEPQRGMFLSRSNFNRSSKASDSIWYDDKNNDELVKIIKKRRQREPPLNSNCLLPNGIKFILRIMIEEGKEFFTTDNPFIERIMNYMPNLFGSEVISRPNYFLKKGRTHKITELEYNKQIKIPYFVEKCFYRNDGYLFVVGEMQYYDDSIDKIDDIFTKNTELLINNQQKLNLNANDNSRHLYSGFKDDLNLLAFSKLITDYMLFFYRIMKLSCKKANIIINLNIPSVPKTLHLCFNHSTYAMIGYLDEEEYYRSLSVISNGLLNESPDSVIKVISKLLKRLSHHFGFTDWKVIDNIVINHTLIELKESARHSSMSEIDFNHKISPAIDIPTPPSNIVEKISHGYIRWMKYVNFNNCVILERLQSEGYSFSFDTDDQGNAISLSFSHSLDEPFPRDVCQLSELKSLHFSSESMISLPNEIGNLILLESLILSLSSLKCLPSTIGQLKNLKSLYLYKNELESLPDTFVELKNLEVLDLAKNHFTTITESINQLKNLKEIYLEDNNFETLPDSFKEFKNIITLDLSRNKFNIIPNQVWNLRSLEKLYLTGNQLKDALESIALLENLKKLYLSECKLLVFPISILKLLNLEYLDISSNFLTELPENMENLTKLEYLYLRNNKFTHIPINKEKFPNLRILSVEDDIHSQSLD